MSHRQTRLIPPYPQVVWGKKQAWSDIDFVFGAESGNIRTRNFKSAPDLFFYFFLFSFCTDLYCSQSVVDDSICLREDLWYLI